MPKTGRTQRDLEHAAVNTERKGPRQSTMAEARAGKGAAGDWVILTGLLVAASAAIASDGALFGEASQLVATSLILCLGLIVLVLRWDRVSTIARSRLGLLAAVNGVILVISSVFSQYHWASIRELLKALALAESFVVASGVIRRETLRDRLLIWFYWWSVGVAAVGIVVYVCGMRWPGSWLGNCAARTMSTFGGRLSTFFGYANAFASFLLVPIALGVAMVWQGGRRSNWALPGLATVLIAMQLTASRWGYAVLGIVLGAMLILCLRLRSGSILFARRRAVIVTGLVMAVALASMVVPSPSLSSSAVPVSERFGGISAEVRNTDPATSSIGGRIAMLRDALRYAGAYPVLGSGPGTYSSVYFRFRSTNFFSADPHSEPMLWLTETGVIGLLAQAVVLLAVLWLLWVAAVQGAARDPAWLGAAAGITGVVTHAMLDWDFQSFFLPVIVALFCGAAASAVINRGVWLLAALPSDSATPRSGSIGIRRSRLNGRFLAVSATAVCIVVGALTATGALVSDKGIALAGSSAVEAAHLFAGAQRLNPANSEYPYLYAKAAITLTASGSVPSMDEAIRDGFDRAIALNRWYIKYQIEQAKYLLAEGDTDAVTVYENLTHIDPGDPGTFTSLAWAYHVLYQNDAKATQALDQAFAVDKGYYEAWLVLGRIRESQGKVSDAIAAYWKAVDADTTDVQALGSLGSLYEAQSNAAGAARAAFELVQRAPDSASAKTAFSSFGLTIKLDHAILDVRSADVAWSTRGKQVAESYKLVLIQPGMKDVVLAEGIDRGKTTVRALIPQSVQNGSYKLRLYAMAPAALASVSDPWVSWVESDSVDLAIP